MTFSIRMHEIVTAIAPLAALPMIGTLMFMAERARTRRALARLDDVRLNDIGLNARLARQETNKAFWH